MVKNFKMEVAATHRTRLITECRNKEGFPPKNNRSSEELLNYQYSNINRDICISTSLSNSKDNCVGSLFRIYLHAVFGSAFILYIVFTIAQSHLRIYWINYHILCIRLFQFCVTSENLPDKLVSDFVRPSVLS